MRPRPCTPPELTVDHRQVRYRIVLPSPEPSAPNIGHPLLLIHGPGCSAEAWGPSLRSLARQGLDQPVFAPDMPGFAYSLGPRRALGMEELGHWCARLLDTLEIPRVHIGATSMGCQVALALARRHPERVGAMVLAAPTTGRRLASP